MIPAFARTFDEYVSWMADNAPHSTVMVSWNRLDGALHEYAVALNLPHPAESRARFDEMVSAPDRLGPERAQTIRKLREMRDAVAAHRVTLTAEEARRFMIDALNILAVVAQHLGDSSESGSRERVGRRWWRPTWAPQA